MYLQIMCERPQKMLLINVLVVKHRDGHFLHRILCVGLGVRTLRHVKALAHKHHMAWGHAHEQKQRDHSCQMTQTSESSTCLKILSLNISRGAPREIPRIVFPRLHGSGDDTWVFLVHFSRGFPIIHKKNNWKGRGRRLCGKRVHMEKLVDVDIISTLRSSDAILEPRGFEWSRVENCWAIIPRMMWYGGAHWYR